MGFLDKLSESGNKAVDKAKELSAVAGYNSQIEKDTKEIDLIFTEIGKHFYYQKKEILQAEAKVLSDKVDALYASIELNKKAILTTRGIEICPNCKGEVAKDVKFCPGCGTKMPEKSAEAPKEAAPSITCPSCGQTLPGDCLFCTACGTKIG